MHGLRKPNIRCWLSLVTIGLVVIGTLSTAIAACHPGAPKEVKLGYVDFFLVVRPFSGLLAVMRQMDGAPMERRRRYSWRQGQDDRSRRERGLAQVTSRMKWYRMSRSMLVVGYTSSANCLAIGPVAEELQMLTADLRKRALLVGDNS